MKGIELLSVFFIAIVAIGGAVARLLTVGGALIAFFVGSSVWIGLGLDGLLLLATFFLTSSFWSLYRRDQKSESAQHIEKGEQRDAYQVLANGGWAALFALYGTLFQEEVFYVGAVCALATANSDTWASEIGVLSKGRPIHVFTLQRVPRGTSGGVTVLGTVAGGLGAATIAFLASLLEIFSLEAAIVVFLFAVGGMWLDTLLGATIQRKQRCLICKNETEARIHCGQRTVYLRGLKWMTNDVVNASAIGVSTIASLYIVLLT